MAQLNSTNRVLTAQIWKFPYPIYIHCPGNRWELNIRHFARLKVSIILCAIDFVKFSSSRSWFYIEYKSALARSLYDHSELIKELFLIFLSFTWRDDNDVVLWFMVWTKFSPISCVKEKRVSLTNDKWMGSVLATNDYSSYA